MTKRFISLCLATSTAFIVAACGSSEQPQPESGDDVEIEDLDGKADGVTKPVGTYKPNGTTPGYFTLLVLETNKVFHAEKQVKCVTTPCNPIHATGTYKFTKSTTSGKRFIRFDEGGDISRFEYKLETGGKLSVRPEGGGLWEQMKHPDLAWCDTAAACKLQSLPQPKCPGGWQCEGNACSFTECSGENACEAAGGSCVALGPNGCKVGSVGDATKYSCGGALGVQCCLPAPEAPTCKFAGTNQEGWYSPDGTKICAANCGGATVTCGAVGSKSEGWYAPSGEGCGGGALIAWDKCGLALTCDYLDTEIFLVTCGSKNLFLRHWTANATGATCADFWTLDGKQFLSKQAALASKACDTKCLRAPAISVSLIRCGAKTGYIKYSATGCGDLLDTPDGIFKSLDDWNSKTPCP